MVMFIDILSLPKIKQDYRIMYDTKGRFVLKKIKKSEAQFKLLKVRKKALGPNQIPYITTHDGRTIRYPHPDIKVNDTIKYNLDTGEIVAHCHFASGNCVLITGGNNIGRVGTIINRERHLGGFDIVHVKDRVGHSFATRIGNIFMIGKGATPWITLPTGDGIKKTIMQERNAHLAPVSDDE